MVDGQQGNDKGGRKIIIDILLENCRVGFWRKYKGQGIVGLIEKGRVG